MRASLFPLIAAGAVVLSACSTAPGEQSQAPTEERGAAAAPKPVPSTPPVAGVQAKPIAGSPFAALKDPSSILSKRQVYFDFDKFDVRDEYRPLVEAHAKFLRENPSAKMLIQGNADERGSREYNVGLGQRRSDALKKMFTLLGVKESQIESVSLGEEKPSCTEHGEQCWAKNRRDDMLYNGEY